MKKGILIVLIGLFLFNCNSIFGQTNLASVNNIKLDSLEFVNRIKQDSLYEATQMAKQRQLEIENLKLAEESQILKLKEQEAKAKIQKLLLLISLVGIILLTVLSMGLFIKSRKLQKIIEDKELK